jgi:hypothetical protein
MGLTLRAAPRRRKRAQSWHELSARVSRLRRKRGKGKRPPVIRDGPQGLLRMKGCASDREGDQTNIGAPSRAANNSSGGLNG